MSHHGVTTRDGLRLAVQEYGDPVTPTVVAVHGYPDDHAVWDGVVAALRTDHHVVTYDVRGAGASGAPRARSGYHLDRLADDLGAVLDAVSPNRPVHLLAHDWGAIQTWHFVTGDAAAGRVASFTSISGPSLDHVGSWYRSAGRRAVVHQSLASWYTALFRMPVLPELAWRSGLFGWVLARRERMPRPLTRNAVNGLGLYRENIAARIADPRPRRTDIPVQVIVPSDDRYVTDALATEIGAYVSDLLVRRIPGGHWGVLTDGAEVVARCVRELVAQVELRSPGRASPVPPTGSPRRRPRSPGRGRRTRWG